MSEVTQPTQIKKYGLRPGAEEFPLMIVISIIYPCNYGCPNCPYTDSNSEIRRFYHERKGDLFPVELWKKIAVEAGPYSAWLRCTGGGEPMLHPHMVDMVEFAKQQAELLGAPFVLFHGGHLITRENADQVWLRQAGPLRCARH